MYRDLERGITPIAFVAPWLPIPAFRRRDAALRGLQAAFADIVAQRRERGWRGEDFLQTLMETRYQDGRRLSDDEITGLLIAMLFAGHHTSSATLAWTIIELLQNPQHLESLRAELVGVSGEDGLVTFQSLKNTPQLDDFVHEVLRLHPPLFMLIRKVVTEFAYGDYRIQAGAYAVASPAVSHSIPEMFTAPDQFDPDRYGPGREEDKTPNALISFGGGHHRCPGMRFGLLQVKAIVAVLLRAFELVPEQPRPAGLHRSGGRAATALPPPLPTTHLILITSRGCDPPQSTPSPRPARGPADAAPSVHPQRNSHGRAVHDVVEQLRQ